MYNVSLLGSKSFINKYIQYTQRELFKYIVLELRTFVLKYILVSMFSMLEQNGEKRKVKFRTNSLFVEI